LPTLPQNLSNLLLTFHHKRQTTQKLNWSPPAQAPIVRIGKSARICYRTDVSLSSLERAW
ncbi:MAG: hypothetical protein JW719_13110, partial [Pirellulales bacterium]|nr:hypothetical protein [Pirellulales bacterium]